MGCGDTATGKERFGVDASELHAYDVAFSFDGNLIAAGGTNNTVFLLDATTGETLAKLEGHTDSPFVVTFSPDGKYLASGGADETVKLWDISLLKPKTGNDPGRLSPEPLSQRPVSEANGANGIRTWTDKSGQFKIEAKLLQYRAGRARLEKPDGTTTGFQSNN